MAPASVNLFPQRRTASVTLHFQLSPTDHTPFERAYVDAVGVVFVDVDLPTSASLRPVLPTLGELVFADPGQFSFLGIRWTSEGPFYGVRMNAGNHELHPAVFDGAQRPGGGVFDVVAVDNIIFSEPRVVPEPPTWAAFVLGLLACVAGCARRKAF